MTFSMYPLSLHFILLLWIIIIQIMSIHNLLRSVQLGKGVTYCVLSGLWILFAYCMMQIWYVEDMGVKLYTVFHIGLPHYIGVLLVLTVIAVYQQVQIRKWSKNNISAMSIKEGFDNLPTGLICYYPSGMPKLVNVKMQTIIQSLTRDTLRNASVFWDDLKSGVLVGCIKGGDNPIYRLSDESVYSFRRYSLSMENDTIFELLATDVTEEYRLTETLQDKQKQADYINVRLKALLGMMEYLVMERELAELKVALHDNLGKGLLLAKRYLIVPESVDREELCVLWNRNISVLKDEQPEFWQKPYYMSKTQAMLFGIELVTEGELPTAERWIPVIDTAITVHVTNTLRHAEGTQATLSVNDKGKRWVIVFTNNGKPPNAEVRETGGLANLRRKVEGNGGEMVVSSIPYFEMKIILPKEEEDVL